MVILGADIYLNLKNNKSNTHGETFCDKAFPSLSVSEWNLTQIRGQVQLIQGLLHVPVVLLQCVSQILRGHSGGKWQLKDPAEGVLRCIWKTDPPRRAQGRPSAAFPP